MKCEVRQVTFQKSQISYTEHMSRYFCLLHTSYCSIITGLDLLSMLEKGRLILKDKGVMPVLHIFKRGDLPLKVEYNSIPYLSE